MGILSSLRALKRDAVKPPIVTYEMKQEALFRAGYALGFIHGVEESIEIVEYEQEEGD